MEIGTVVNTIVGYVKCVKGTANVGENCIACCLFLHCGDGVCPDSNAPHEGKTFKRITDDVELLLHKVKEAEDA